MLIELKRRGKEPYYWTDKKQEEIDFIIKNKENTLEAIGTLR